MRRETPYRRNRAYQVLAVLADMTCLAVALVLAMWIRFRGFTDYPFSAYTGTWVFFALWLFVFSTVENLYSFRTSLNRTLYAYRFIRLVLITGALYVLTVFLLKNPRGLFIDSRISIVLFMFFWALLGILVRMVLLPGLYRGIHGVLRRRGARALVLGEPRMSPRIAALVGRAPVYPHDDSVAQISEVLPDSPDEIFRFCMHYMNKYTSDQVYLLFGNHDLNCIAEASILLHEAGVPFAIFSESILSLGYFDPWLSLEDYGAVSFLKRGRMSKNDLPARTVDLLTSVAALVLLSPLLLALALLVKLSGPGPVFFRQVRVGLNTREFPFLKFRSMKPDTTGKGLRDHQQYFARYARGQTTGKPDTFKLDQKSRITPVGRLLRKTSLDELPQLINVFRGEMTLVGPRPCIPYELEHYRDWQRRRFTVKPGLTGIWQVYGRSRLPFDHAQFLDFLYTIDMSYSLDFRLIMKTLPVILMGRGAF